VWACLLRESGERDVACNTTEQLDGVQEEKEAFFDLHR
jgi:hypothetical protein